MYTSLCVWPKTLVTHIQWSPTFIIWTNRKPLDFRNLGADFDGTNWPRPGYCRPAVFSWNCFCNLSIANPTSTSDSSSYGSGRGLEGSTGSRNSVGRLLSMAVSPNSVLLARQ